MDADLQQLITPAQIEEFESSRTALHAVKLIGSVNGHRKCEWPSIEVFHSV